MANIFRKLRITVIILVSVILLLFAIYRVNFILMKNDSFDHLSPFFESKEEYDVLFFGSSHVTSGIYPLELYEDYGMVSYNLGQLTDQPVSWYYLMLEALKHHTPKLIVIDIDSLDVDSKIDWPNGLTLLHRTYDYMPLSRNKIQAIWDNIDPDELNERDKNVFLERMELLFPLYQYHERWLELDYADFDPNINEENGCNVSADYMFFRSLPITDEKYEVPDTVAMQYIEKMKLEAEKRGIPVLFMCLPSYIKPENDTLHQELRNGFEDIAKEWNSEYVNFYHTDVVNYHTDFQEESHLNACGAKKATEYLGEYIKEHYDIPDRRNDQEYQAYNKKLADYKTYKKLYILKDRDIYESLLLQCDEDFNSVIYLRDASMLSSAGDAIYELIWEVASKQGELEQLDAAIKNGTSYLLVVDNSSNKKWEASGNNFLCGDTSFGKVELYEGELPELYIEDSENLLHCETDNKYEQDIRIVPDVVVVSIDEDTQEIVTVNKYDLELQSERLD